MKNRAFSIAVGVLFAIILLTYLFTFQVRATEKAVVLTFGEATRSITEGGLYFQWPWPIQRVEKFDSRMDVFETLLEQTLTRDRQSITVSLAVGWKVGEPEQFRASTRGGMFSVARTFVEDLVGQQSSVIGQYNLNNFVSIDHDQVMFDEIEARLLEPVRRAAMDEYGIDVTMVRIRRLELPEGPTRAVYNRMREERLAEAKRYRAQGRGAAAEIRARAESAREQILARARSEAEIIKAEGDAAAAAHYEIFDQNKELAIFLREARALREILAERSTVILDPRTAPFNIFLDGVAIPTLPAAAGDEDARAAAGDSSGSSGSGR